MNRPLSDSIRLWLSDQAARNVGHGWSQMWRWLTASCADHAPTRPVYRRSSAFICGWNFLACGSASACAAHHMDSRI